VKAQAFVLVPVLVVATAAWSGLPPQREEAMARTAEAVHAFNRGDYAQAQALLVEALSIDESICEAHFWLGRIYATRAGSDPEARQEAMGHFARGLELNPYGEMGDLLRGWLSKVGGRGRLIRILPARVNEAGFRDNSRVTEDLLRSLHGTMIGQASAECGEDWISPTSLTVDYLKSLTVPSHADACGWLALVGVHEFRRDRDEDGTQRCSMGARVWLADPLVGHVYEPIDLDATSSPGLSLLDSLLEGHLDLSALVGDSDDPYGLCLSRLKIELIELLRRSGVDPYELELVDEMLVPTPSPGVYARAATAEYDEVLARPVIGIAADIPDDDGPVFDRLLEAVHRTLIARSGYNVVSAYSTRSFLDTDDVADNWPQLATSMAQAMGANYLCQIACTKPRLSTSTYVLAERARLTMTARVSVVEVASAEEVCCRELEARREKWMGLFGNSDAFARWAAPRLSDMADQLAKGVAEAVMAALPPPEDVEVVQ